MQARQMVDLVETALDDSKARDFRVLNVMGKSPVTDYMVIASGSSSRHVCSVAKAVVKAAREAGQGPLGVEGAETGDWVLVDLGDVLVHVMQPEVRAFYDLERLWQPDLVEEA